MNKLKTLLFAGVSAFALASCTTYTVSVNTNGVGSKEGEVTASGWKVTQDVTIANAAQNGGINEIGLVEYKYRQIIIWTQRQMKVYGN